MASPIRKSVAPLYLFLCIVLGGCAQGIWANMVLQLLGVAILVLAAASPSTEGLTSTGRHLLLLALGAVALIALQMLPLPPSLWMQLGGRQIIVDGNATLGLGAPWLPLSLAPYRTFDALLGPFRRSRSFARSQALERTGAAGSSRRWSAERSPASCSEPSRSPQQATQPPHRTRMRRAASAWRPAFSPTAIIWRRSWWRRSRFLRHSFGRRRVSIGSEA